MMLTLILLVISVLLIFVIISLEGKLKDGRRRIAGRKKTAFIRYKSAECR